MPFYKSTYKFKLSAPATPVKISRYLVDWVAVSNNPEFVSKLKTMLLYVLLKCLGNLQQKGMLCCVCSSW